MHAMCLRVHLRTEETKRSELVRFCHMRVSPASKLLREQSFSILCKNCFHSTYHHDIVSHITIYILYRLMDSDDDDDDDGPVHGSL